MSGGFNNPVVDQTGNLQITSVQSPGFSVGPPIVGWQIDKNGQAFFQSISVGSGVQRTFVQATAPVSPNVNDLWVNTSNGNVLEQWNGSAWVVYQIGTGAVANGAITAALIAANTITAAQLAAGIVYAGIVDSTTISTATLNTVTINGTNYVMDNQGMKIYDSGTNTLRAQVSGQSNNDPFGNQMAIGYVGSAKNWIPGTPGTLDGWNNVAAPSGWTGVVNRYKNLAEFNIIIVDFQMSNPGTSGNVTVMTLPPAYRPNADRSFPMWLTTTGTTPNTLRVSVTKSTGAVTTSSLPSSTTNIGATFLLPLD